MTDSNTVSPNGVVDLSNAPAGLDDATFDSLFPAEAQTTVLSASQTQPVPQPENPPAPALQAQPVTQTSNAPFIKGERSVYNTPEAAVQGINQKDALIEQLRQRYALTTGIDPITGQPIGQNPSPQNIDYSNNPKKYIEDLFAAAQAAKDDPSAYVGVQSKFMMDTLRPLQPLMHRVAKEQALEALGSEIKEAPAYVGTPAYQKALDSNPELKEAITSAETDYRWHSRLPSLYKIAYLTGQGMQLPELLRAQSVPQPQTSNTPAPRPTGQPSTPAMPTATTRPSFKTLDGIRAIIADAESRGAPLDF
jgi:hypothetical protein